MLYVVIHVFITSIYVREITYLTQLFITLAVIDGKSMKVEKLHFLKVLIAVFLMATLITQQNKYMIANDKMIIHCKQYDYII